MKIRATDNEPIDERISRAMAMMNDRHQPDTMHTADPLECGHNFQKEFARAIRRLSIQFRKQNSHASGSRRWNSIFLSGS